MHVLLQINMEEDEIDGWYEEEKQKIMDDYLKNIEDGKNKVVSEKKYRDKLAKTIARYNKLMDEKLTKKKKNPNIFSRLKDKFSRKK